MGRAILSDLGTIVWLIQCIEVIYISSNLEMKYWLVLIRNAKIKNFECIHRGLELAFRNDRCFQMSLSFI